MDDVYFLEDCDVNSDLRIVPLPQDQGKFSVVLLFAHWCHNCTGIKPEYQSLAAPLSDKVRFYAVNGTGNRGDSPSNASEQALMKRIPEMVKPFKFRGFPSVFLFDKEGSCIAEFDGERTAQGLMLWLKKNQVS